MSFNLINCYKNIENESVNISASTGRGLDRYLETVGEMDVRHRAHLKSQPWISKAISTICWWKQNEQKAYRHCYRSLVGRIAAGYENKMLSLLVCKHLLKDQVHRDFCADALKQAFSNTYNNKQAKGMVWKVTNQDGVTNYLVGTIHQGTKSMGLCKGVQEALRNSDRFFLEKGLIAKYYKCSYFPLMTRDPRLLFILDRYIALEAHAKGKKNYVLDNQRLTVETNHKSKNASKKQNVSLSEELPSEDYFSENVPANDPRWKKIIQQISHTYHVQSVNDWQRGEESIYNFNSDYFTIVCDGRTNAWLEQSFDSIKSDKPLPGLIEQVRDAKKPICIAVGEKHCIGSKISLVEEFQRAGFKVECY